MLWSIKPSEDGIENGLVTRFWNMDQVADTPVLTFAKPILRAWKTTHIETDEAALKTAYGLLKLSFTPNQINSYRIITALNRF